MKYIIQRSINAHTAEYAQALRDLSLEGYTTQFTDIKRAAKNSSQRSSIVLMKPEDIHWIKDNQLEAVKIEVGFAKKDCTYEEYTILRIPHNIDFPDWKDLSTSKFNQKAKPKYFEAVNEYNFGFPLESHADKTGIKNNDFLLSIRDKMVDTFRIYERDLQCITPEMLTVAEELYQVYSEEKKAKDGRNKTDKVQKTVENTEEVVQESVSEDNSVEIELPEES